MQPCALCGRMEETTRHHLYPRSMHTRLKKKRAQGAKRLLGADLLQTVELCPPCHQRVHQLFNEKELAETFCSVAALASNEQVRQWLDWIRGKPVGFRPTTRSWKTRR